MKTYLLLFLGLLVFSGHTLAGDWMLDMKKKKCTPAKFSFEEFYEYLEGEGSDCSIGEGNGDFYIIDCKKTKMVYIMSKNLSGCKDAERLYKSLSK